MNTWQHQAEFEQRFINFATKERVSQHLEKIKSYVRGRDPNDVFRVDILNYRDSRLRQAAPNTVRSELTYGKSFWTWLQDREYVDHNPFDNVKLPPPPPQKRRWLPNDVVTALRKDCPANLRTALEILAYTPLDCLTVATLRKENFDFENKLIHTTRGKTKVDWVIPVPDCLLDFINTLPAGPLYPALLKRRQPGQEISRLFAMHAKKVLGYNPGAHSLRHTYATEALRNDVDIRTVQELMGHRDINTTALYLTPSDSSSVRAFLGKFHAQESRGISQ